METSGEILCISGSVRNYAVEFKYIKEICSDILVSKVPCLPEYFAGVFHYRGAIIPVIRLDEEVDIPEQKTQKAVVLILEHLKYQLGIIVSREPFMVQEQEMTRVEMPQQEENAVSDIWIGKAFYKLQDTLYSLGDVEKIMEHLIVYPAV